MFIFPSKGKENKWSGNLPWMKLAKIWEIDTLNVGRKSSNHLHNTEQLFKPFQSDIHFSDD